MLGVTFLSHADEQLSAALQKMFETQVLDYISDNFTSLKTEGYLSMNPNQYPKHIKMRGALTVFCCAFPDIH